MSLKKHFIWSYFKVKYVSIFIKTFWTYVNNLKKIQKNAKKKCFFLSFKIMCFFFFLYAGIFLYPGCEKNIHIWFVQKNYILTFLGTFYKIYRYSPTCKFSVLLHIFVLIFLVRHWRSYLFWKIPKLTLHIEPPWVILGKNLLDTSILKNH